MAVAEDGGGALLDSQVGFFKIVSLLGSGGMGKSIESTIPIWFAKWPSRFYPSHLPIIPSGSLEAKLLAELNHMNIVTIHSLEQSGAQPLLVLELEEGPTLAGRLRNGPLPVELALNCVSRLRIGLEVAHERFIIHAPGRRGRRSESRVR